LSINTIENMVNWIEDNITSNPTLAEMSDYVGYSPFYCSTKFRENIGITFKKYISKRRLSLAALDVKNTQERFLDIAVKYGFSSQEAFTRAFSSAYGCTPCKFRNQRIAINLYMKPDILPVPKDDSFTF